MSKATRPVVPKINQLIAKWEKQAWPVVCSRFINLPGSNWERLLDWHKLQKEPETLLAEDLEVNTPFIFQKSTYSAWSSEVIAVCAENNVRDVITAGVDTNECVFATACAVFDPGYTPVVVMDCCASMGGEKSHNMALTLLETIIGKQQLITSREVL